MKATNCSRYTFDLGGEKLKYSALRRYVCNDCGGQVTHRAVWNDAEKRSEDRVACARCGSIDIISESARLRRTSQTLEARYSLPPKVRKFYEQRGHTMPLKDVEGLGDLTKLGNIRLGWMESTESGRERPVASDYFVLTDAPFLAEILGEQPQALQIHFPYPLFDDNITAAYRVWAGGRRKGSGISVCQGDGEIVHSALPFKVSVDGEGRTHVNRAKGPRLVSYKRVAVDFKWGDHSFQVGDSIPCPGGAKGMYPHCEVCNPSILLKVMIRHPLEAARWGYWQIATGSIRNYRHFMGVWSSITNGGQLPIPMNDVPFVLRIMPEGTLFQGRDQSWSAKKAFFLKLELDRKVAELVEGARDRRFVAMLEGRVDPMLVPQLSARLESDFDDPYEDSGDDGIDEQLPFDEPPVENGTYDEMYLEEDPFTEEETEPDESPAPVENVPAPRGLNHNNFVEKAVDLLPAYQNAGQVKAAMLALTNDSAWERSTEWSPRDYWPQLQAHTEAK